jgi:hypothetical protein
MSSEKQKQAARKNIKKAQTARRDRGGSAGSGMSTAEKDRLKDSQFAFPDERKEPLNDAARRAKRDRPVRSGRERVGCGARRGVEADFAGRGSLRGRGRGGQLERADQQLTGNPRDFTSW